MYDFVTRHFLACLSKDAVGTETTAKINIAGEVFTAKGLVLQNTVLLIQTFISTIGSFSQTSPIPGSRY